MRTRTGRIQARLASPRSGFILIAVLVIVILASMVVASLLFRLRAEETAAAGGAGSEQAWATAMSGVYEAMRVASKEPPGSLEWQDNPAAFREHLVFDDGSDHWSFSVYSAGDLEQQDIRFGLTDEAAKLNINQATEEMLEKLPGMTPYLAQGLLDFIDPDDVPRPEGAEQEYYDALPIPYKAANAALTTLDSLLLVRGFTPALLYGEDANWNFQLDPNEDDGDLQFPPDNKDAKLDAGLRQYMTVCSYDPDLDNSGAARLDLNAFAADASTNQPAKLEDFPPSLLPYLQALERNKAKLEQPADLLEAKNKFKDEKGRETELESGIGKAELPQILDRFTTRSQVRVAGLINVNTASARVLQSLPGVDEALADAIVSARRNLRPEQRRTPAWLYQEGVVDAGQFKGIMPHLTTRSYQYHFHVVGYGVPSGRYRVLEVIIDTATPNPAILYLRDVTRLGLPFSIEIDEETPEPAGSSGQSQPSAAQSRSKGGVSLHHG